MVDGSVFGGRRAALLLLLAALPVCGTADTPVSPDDPLYDHLRSWEQRGLVRWLPPLRPLPAPIVRDALRQVAESDHEADRRIARRLLRRSFGPRSWQVEGRLTARSKTTADAAPRLAVVPELAAGAQLPLGDHFGFGAAARTLPAGPPGRPAAADRATPRYAYDRHDPYDPIASGDGVTLAGQEYHVDLAGHVFAGPPGLRGAPGDWYVQAGFGQHSFGFADDSTIVSSYAPPAGSVAATWRGAWLAWSALFLDLVAVYGCSAAAPDDCGVRGMPYPLRRRAAERNDHPSKYLMVQSLSVYPAPWLELTALQSVLFGGRMSLTYLLPLLPSQYLQTYQQDYDNAFVGAAARVRLPFGASASAVLYVDDLNFRRLRELSFDSGQNKLALDLSGAIAPPLPILTVIDARYRMVTPYLYAHHPAALDYLQYTHRGRPLGTLLPPNSDEIRVRARTYPAPWLALDLSVRNVRHGGGCGGTPDSQCTIWHHGLIDGRIVFHGPSRFLRQDLLEHVLQARVGIDLSVDVAPVEMSVGLAYTYEQVGNRGLAPGADGQSHLLEVSTAVRY